MIPESQYTHYDVSNLPVWAKAAPSELGARSLTFLLLSDYLITDYQMTSGEKLPLSEREIQAIADAREFVESVVGIPAQCVVNKYATLEDGMSGLYDSMLDEIGFITPDTGALYGDAIALGSLLVHELAHSTGRDTTRFIDLEDETGHSLIAAKSHDTAEVTASYDTDNFFEEALAEEIASRWRMQFDERLVNRERELISRSGRPALPLRMFSPAYPIDSTSCDIERGCMYSSYCSFGVKLLSEYTGVDIFQLLIDSRYPDKQVEACSKLKITVDSVEPGLFDILTGAEYSLEDFIDGFEIIKQAIANHAIIEYNKDLEKP